LYINRKATPKLESTISLYPPRCHKPRFPFPSHTTPIFSHRGQQPPTLLLLPLHKLQRLLLTDYYYTTALILIIPDAIALLGHEQHLGSKRRADKLAAAQAAFLGRGGAVRYGLEHVGDGGAVLGVEVGVDFVEEVEGGRVALLDGEDEGKGAEACLWNRISKGGFDLRNGRQK